MLKIWNLLSPLYLHSVEVPACAVDLLFFLETIVALLESGRTIMEDDLRECFERGVCSRSTLESSDRFNRPADCCDVPI